MKLAVSIDGKIHFDFRLNFGAASVPGVFGHVADAIVTIYCHRGVDNVLKWVNDFIFFQYAQLQDSTFVYSYDKTLIHDIANDLGWPWSTEKHSPFASRFTYIGFLWSLETKPLNCPIKNASNILLNCTNGLAFQKFP